MNTFKLRCNDPKMHDPKMHESCINYPNKLKLCRENNATGKLNFPNKKPSFCSCEHTLLRDITCDLAGFFKLPYICMLTEPLSSTITQLFYKKVFLKIYL